MGAKQSFIKCKFTSKSLDSQDDISEIIPGIYVGSYPRDLDQLMRYKNCTRPKMSYVVNLSTEAYLLNPVFDQIHNDFSVLELPIEESLDSLPSRDKIQLFIDFCNKAKEDKKAIFIHCRGGLIRAGIMVCAYLIRYGMEPRMALELFQSKRGNLPTDLVDLITCFR